MGRSRCESSGQVTAIFSPESPLLQKAVIEVFWSRPNSINRSQISFCKQLEVLIRESGLLPITLGVTHSANSVPSVAVQDSLSKCRGAIILGLRQIHIADGIEKKGSKSARILKDEYLPTAWNQIEAGMALMRGIPVMLIAESGVKVGVFESGATDRFVHRASSLSKAWLDSSQFQQPFAVWVKDVKKFRHSEEVLDRN